MGSAAEVRRCHLTNCPLWPFRFGKVPMTAAQREARLGNLRKASASSKNLPTVGHFGATKDAGGAALPARARSKKAPTVGSTGRHRRVAAREDVEAAVQRMASTIVAKGTRYRKKPLPFEEECRRLRRKFRAHA